MGLRTGSILQGERPALGYDAKMINEIARRFLRMCCNRPIIACLIIACTTKDSVYCAWKNEKACLFCSFHDWRWVVRAGQSGLIQGDTFLSVLNQARTNKKMRLVSILVLICLSKKCLDHHVCQNAFRLSQKNCQRVQWRFVTSWEELMLRRLMWSRMPRLVDVSSLGLYCGGG